MQGTKEAFPNDMHGIFGEHHWAAVRNWCDSDVVGYFGGALVDSRRSTPLGLIIKKIKQKKIKYLWKSIPHNAT